MNEEIERLNNEIQNLNMDLDRKRASCEKMARENAFLREHLNAEIERRDKYKAAYNKIDRELKAMKQQLDPELDAS